MRTGARGARGFWQGRGVFSAALVVAAVLLGGGALGGCSGSGGTSEPALSLLAGSPGGAGSADGRDIIAAAAALARDPRVLSANIEVREHFPQLH